MARFTREAQVLASLNHPGIAAIYGIEDYALVLELVDGPTVADRIAQGRIDLDEALPIARQIADALEAAHEQGIIHRDLKPANIKVPDGTVKVLDFGLAKLATGVAPAASKDPAYTVSPTITTPAMTQVGLILGTAAYMSPEQAKGREADKRSEIWAFGCVLFEMLTGTRPFEGDDVSDTLAAVLRAEPDWTRLPDAVPDRIRGLLRRCLQKDRQKRLPHIAMARFEIDELSTESPVAAPSLRTAERTPLVRRLLPLAVATILASAMTSAIWWALRPQPRQPIVARFAIPLAEGEEAAGYPFRSVAISPDGTQIVYAANRRLNLRRLSQGTSTVIQGTGNGVFLGTPAFSPDGSSVAYISVSLERGGGTGAAIHTIGVGGGVPTTVARTRGTSTPGLSWGMDGILYADLDAGVMLVPASGGKPQVIAAQGAGEAMQGPFMIPGTRVFIFAVAKGRDVGTAPTLDLWDTAKIVAQSLDDGERKTLIEAQ